MAHRDSSAISRGTGGEHVTAHPSGPKRGRETPRPLASEPKEGYGKGRAREDSAARAQALGRAFLLLPPLRYIFLVCFVVLILDLHWFLSPKWTLMHPRLPQHLPLARSFSQPIYKVIFTPKMLWKWGRPTKSISPSPSSLSFPTVGWQMGLLSPQRLPMSWEHLKLLRPSVPQCCFQPGFGGLDPRLVLGTGGSRFALEEVGERVMKLPSSSPQIPKSPPHSHNVAWGQQEQPGSTLPAAS